MLPAVRQAVEHYLQALVFRDNVVRIARIDAAILAVDGIADIAGTTLCGTAGNLVLSAQWNLYEIPVIGELMVKEMV